MTELLREGMAQADREEFIEEEEMDARIERMLNS
jgi:predicted transcriptional regulator